MYIFPAIDLRDKKVVRLLKGDYEQMTVYSDDPLSVAKSFEESGAEFLHVVDLDGAKTGSLENTDVIKRIVENTSLKVEVGGGIRSDEAVKRYLDIGVLRVILGTVSVTDPEFLKKAVQKYGDRIAVGVDIKDGFVAINGWTEKSALTCFDFCRQLSEIEVKTIICTDISKDGAMQGTNHELYNELCSRFDLDIIASGGVSSMNDVKKLAKLGVYGAIIGKALYNGAIDLKEAIQYAEKGKGQL